MTHYNTFRDQLAIAHPAFGYALWEPDPGQQYPPVEVGDVGFVRQGKFHRLFNALLPATHESHQRFGVPERYEPLRLSVPTHIDYGTLNPNNFCSYGVTVESGESGVFAVAPPTSSDSAEVSFSCTKKDGAALSLPVVARREDTLSQAHFGKWMTRHVDSCFAFSQRHGLGIDMEDIVLVTGCHRTRSWSNIAFYESQANSRISLSVRAPGNPGTAVHWRVLSQRIQGTVLSHGPSGDNLPENQCLFIRGFRVKRLLWIIPRLRGAAEPQPDPPGYDPEPETELVQIPSVPECRDPLHVLLEYIATRAPNCDMALVHDDDLVQILGAGDGTSLETLQEDVVMNYLQRSKPEIGVMSDTCTANNESPRSDTERVKVAMLSERLHSLDPQASVPLLSHSHGGITNIKEMSDYHVPSDQSSLESCTPYPHSGPGSVIPESEVIIDDIVNTGSLSVGPSGVGGSSLIDINRVSDISNTNVAHNKPGESDIQEEFSYMRDSGHSGVDDGTRGIHAGIAMRAIDILRRPSLSSSQYTPDLYSIFDSDPGSESGVADTDVELECMTPDGTSQRAFDLEQGADWYADDSDTDEGRKEAGSPIIFSNVDSDDGDGSDVSETGTRALAAIRRSSISIREASTLDRSFHASYPDPVPTQPNSRQREDGAIRLCQPRNNDTEEGPSVTVTSSNRDQQPPFPPANWSTFANNAGISPRDNSGKHVYQGMDLDYIMSDLGGLDSRRSSLSFVEPYLPLPKDRRKSKNKEKRNMKKGKEKAKGEDLIDPPGRLPELLPEPWVDDSTGIIRPNTVTLDVSFSGSLRLYKPDSARRRNQWSFSLELVFLPREHEQAGNPSPWVFWHCSQIGQIRIQRTTLPPAGPNKPNQQRLIAEHDVDPESANTLGGPTTVIHRHSRALAFSIYRRYDLKNFRSGGTHNSMASVSTRSPRSSKTRTLVMLAHDGILLATKRVQKQYTTTKSTAKLNSHGLDEGDNRRDTRREANLSHSRRAPQDSSASSPQEEPYTLHHIVDLSRIGALDSQTSNIRVATPSHMSGSSLDLSVITERQLASHDGAEEDSDNELANPASRRSHTEIFATLDHPRAVDQLKNEPVPAPAVRRSHSWIRRFIGPPGDSTPRTLSSSLAPFNPAWATLAPGSVQEEQDRAIKGLRSSFKDVRLVPSSPSKGDIDSKGKGKNNDVLTQIPDDSLYMILPLWPHDTDPASAAREQRQRTPRVLDQEQNVYLLVYYVPFDKRGEGNPVKKRSRLRLRKGERERLHPTPLFDVRRGFKIIGRLVDHSDLNGAGIRLPVRGLSVTGSLAEAELGIPPASFRNVDSDVLVIGVCLDRSGSIELFPEGLERLGLCVPRTVPPVQPHSHPGTQSADPVDEDVVLTAIGRAAVEVAWLGGMALTTFYSPQSQGPA